MEETKKNFRGMTARLLTEQRTTSVLKTCGGGLNEATPNANTWCGNLGRNHDTSCRAWMDQGHRGHGQSPEVDDEKRTSKKEERGVAKFET